MRLGDLDALKKCAIPCELHNGSLTELCVPLYQIDNAPTVEPTFTPQSGHWVEEKISAGARKVFCSECGCPPPFEHVNTGDVYSASGYGVINKTKFCPNCGALMKGGTDMRKPNCVTCDHFGKCEGCEKRDEE